MSARERPEPGRRTPCAATGRALRAAGWQPSDPAFRAFLGDALRVLRVDLAADRFELLVRFRRLILQESAFQNLTAAHGEFELAVRHFADSLTCLVTGFLDSGRAVDVGTGAGFPGVPLAVARPSLRMTLVDSSAARCGFLQRVVGELGLEGCSVTRDRAEHLGRDADHREVYDVAVARALASLAVDLEYCVPLLRVGGRFVAMKGPRVVSELEEAVRAGETLGARLERVVELALPLAGERRCLVVFLKESPTPAAYPRREGIPKKRPLGRR
ncbi:MAG: 16S rRNA (guanine(527)-N(7))-methyltransferase RsmG [Firmicutes bacterium]|nr:16S rRNA (guanine(527)-N(7))-methyltransferase RsmG [Bacillota bacterium]